MVFRTLDILRLIIRETLRLPKLKRRPEPTAAMEDTRSVESFHVQGTEAGVLFPIYHFNALATSRLMPRGGTLVDLGSGSGQYLIHLARCRPDIRIIGLDLSKVMVMAGNRCLETAGLRGRVELQVGDMTNFSQRIPERVSIISSVFAFHHLPTTEDLIRCLGEIARVREKCACGIWIFDHARPRHPRTAELFPEIFTPEAPNEFRQDSRNSLIASFSFSELSQCIDSTLTPGFRHTCSSLIRLYQAHWLEGEGKTHISKDRWVSTSLPPLAYKKFKLFRAIMRAVPLLVTS